MKTIKIKSFDLAHTRVEEDFGFQKLVVAETEKLPLAGSKPGHAAGLTRCATRHGAPCASM